MQRTRPRAAAPGLVALAALLTACGGGHTASATQSDRECTDVVQAANAIVLATSSSVSAADVSRSTAAATALTSAAAKATTAVAGPAGQLASAARAYADALTSHNTEAINVDGGLLRQRAKPVADTCKQTVLGVAPSGAGSGDS